MERKCEQQNVTDTLDNRYQFYSLQDMSLVVNISFCHLPIYKQVRDLVTCPGTCPALSRQSFVQLKIALDMSQGRQLAYYVCLWKCKRRMT